jgi:UDP-N-acetylmuramoyl-tripeptide--D-alanyl-D-alanine ligase
MGAEWGHLRAEEVESATGGEILTGAPDTLLSGISTDSRTILPGQIFWALRGERFDGHDFVPPAFEKGAAALVIEQGHFAEGILPSGCVAISVRDTLKALGDLAAWWRKAHSTRIAAITGSAGKTTTKEMCALILGQKWETLKTQGNFNNLIGLPVTLLRLEMKHTRAVLEMGMNRPGEIGRLTEISDPNVGLITNVGHVHLEGVGDIHGVARAKAELIQRISPGKDIILNGDDPILLSLAIPAGRRITTFGMKHGNDVRAVHVKDDGLSGMGFELIHEKRGIPIRIPVPGRQNIYNALAASAIAFVLGAQAEQIQAGLAAFKGTMGRFQAVPLPNGAFLVDDTYNSNPLSLMAALESVQSMIPKEGRLIVGLGEMLELGAETEKAHLEAGQAVGDLNVALFIALGEHRQSMIEGALQRGLPEDRTFSAENHAVMLGAISEIIRKNDLVLLKGSRKVGLEKVAEGLMAHILLEE